MYDDVLSMAWFFLELIVKSMALEQTRLLYNNLSLGIFYRVIMNIGYIIS